jgi:tetratricopeptide (TPR) repeat protein
VRARKKHFLHIINICKRRLVSYWTLLCRFLSPQLTRGAALFEIVIKFILSHPIRITTTVVFLFLLNGLLTPRSIVILPITVPKYLQDDGYTGTVAAIRLRDALRKFAERANTRMKSPEIALHDDLPDFVVPTVNLSIEVVAAYIRTFFGVERRRNISGEFVVEDNVLRLLLRKNGEVFYRSRLDIDLRNPDDLLGEAASEVYRATEPYFYAVEQSHTDPIEAIKRARLMVADLPRSDPNVVWAHNLIGMIFHQEHRIGNAISEYQNTVDLDPRFATGYSNWGLALLEQGKIDEAIGQFRNAIGSDPHYAWAYYNLGFALEELGMGKEARCEYLNAANEFREAVSVNPNSAIAHYNFGYALQKYQSTSEGQCGRLGGPAGLYHLIFGGAHDSQITSDEYTAEFEEAIRLDPKYAPARVKLGIALKEKGKLDDATGHFMKAIEADPHYVDAYLNLALVLKSQGKSDSAHKFQSIVVAEYKAAIARDPNDALAHNKLGNVLQDRGQLTEAIDEYSEAIKLDPKYFAAYANRGLTNLLAERYEPAASDLSHVAWEHEDQAYRILWLYLARVSATKSGLDNDYAWHELWSGAQKLREHAKMLKLKKPEWPFPVIELLLDLQNVENTLNDSKRLDNEAAKRLAKPDIHNKACEAHFYVGKLYLLRAKAAEAREALKEAERVCPNEDIESIWAKAELNRLTNTQ